MPKYILTYHVAPDKQAQLSPEAGKAGQKKFMDWAQSIESITIFPNAPCFKTKTVADGEVTDGGGPDAMMGFTIIEENDMESAVEIAKSCPHQEMIGPVKVAECGEMPK